jgi:hypothetical protein
MHAQNAAQIRWVTGGVTGEDQDSYQVLIRYVRNGSEF